MYYAAAPDDHGTVDVPGTAETFNHRVYVLENTADDPFTGEWVERGQVDTGWESFALDATSTVIDGQQYLVWAQQAFDVRGHSNLYIAPMANPWTLAGPAVELTRPEFDWETKASGSTRARRCWCAAAGCSSRTRAPRPASTTPWAC